MHKIVNGYGCVAITKAINIHNNTNGNTMQPKKIERARGTHTHLFVNSLGYNNNNNNQKKFFNDKTIAIFKQFSLQAQLKL